MPSGFLWESFGGLDFFSWGKDGVVLGIPSISLASMFVPCVFPQILGFISAKISFYPIQPIKLELTTQLVSILVSALEI